MNTLFNTFWDTNLINITGLLIALSISAVLGVLTSWHYKRFSRNAQYQVSLASLLPFIGLTVCFIIWIIQGSIALSLGLVGALSIVRFRTAIKEPEDLGYIFSVIAIGIGAGSGNTTITIVGSIFILLMATLFRLRGNKSLEASYTIFLACDKKSYPTIKKILNTKIHCNITSVTHTQGKTQCTASTIGSSEMLDELTVYFDDAEISVDWNYVATSQFPIV
jgi:hypothetical protein